MHKPHYVAPWVRCPVGGHPIEVDERRVVQYFRDEAIACPTCGAVLDWWTTACREVEENFMHNQAFAFLGAETIIFQLQLRNAERTTYQFSHYGIPAGAKILYVNYTPQGGGLFPIEIHGNLPLHRGYFDRVALYPVPLGTDKPGDTNVSVMVTWTPKTPDDDSWQSLVDAFEAFAHGRYASMIVPANVAVEAALSRALTTYLSRFASKKRVETFLQDAATYSHQLNVVLPLISALKSLPPLPDHVRGALNKLRELRNELAHSGALATAVDARGAAEVICGALFGLHYVRHLERELSKT